MKMRITSSLSKLLLVILWLVAPAVRAGIFSTYTQTNASQRDDLLLTDVTNNGNTHTVKTVTVGNLAKSIPFTSNQVFQAFTLNPTNIFTSPGTVTGTNGTHILIGSAGAFTGVKLGWNIAIGVSQYTVIKIINATQLYTFEPLGANYTNSAFNFYPDAEVNNDINGNPQGWVGNDASVGIVGETDFQANSGALWFADGTNSFRVAVENQTQGSRLEFAPFSAALTAPFSINAAAQGDALEIYSDSTVSVKKGLTNRFGSLNLLGSVSVPSNLVVGSGIGLATTNTFSPSFTCSGTINNAVLIGSAGGAFNPSGPGWEISANGTTYVITGITDSTHVQVFPLITGTFAGASFTLIPPALVSSNTTPAAACEITSSGKFLGDASLSSGGFLFADYTNSVFAHMKNEADGYRLEFEVPSQNVPLSIHTSAGFDSLRIQSNGVCLFSFGATIAAGGLGVQAGGITNAGGIVSSGDDTNLSGNFVAGTAGKGLVVKGGANARAGTVQLAAGSNVVANTSVTANTKIFLQIYLPAGAPLPAGGFGVLGYTNNPGVGFTIFSGIPGTGYGVDTNQVNYWLVETN
jgi:hypothetical protein